MSKKKGKNSQKQKEPQRKGEYSPGTILVPYGKEVFGTTPAHQVEPGDYERDVHGEITRIFDCRSRSGVIEWHDVVFDDESGEYLLLDEVIARYEEEEDEEAISKAEAEQLGLPWAPPKKKGGTVTRHMEYQPKGVQYTNSKGKSKYTYQPTDSKGIRLVVKETNEVYETKQYWVCKDFRDSGMPYTTDDSGVAVFVVGINQLRFKKLTPTVQMCGYDATAKYVEHICGKKLDFNDQDFYRSHPWTDQHGIGLAAMPTVIHQLVEPYKLGVSRIRFPKGIYLKFEDRDAWVASLGENPMQGDNYEFAEAMEQDLNEVQELFRIDYGELPFAPSVCAYDTSIMSGGGHVSYIGPRGSSYKSWQISVCIAPLNSFKYKVPLVLTPIDKAKDDMLALDWDEVRDEQGKRVSKVWKGSTGYTGAPYGSGRGTGGAGARQSGYSRPDPYEHAWLGD